MRSRVQVFLSIYSVNIFKNSLALFPINLKITDQIKRVEAQAFFLSIEDKFIAAVICKKVG